MTAKKNIQLHHDYSQLLLLNNKVISTKMQHLCRPLQDCLYADAFFHSHLAKDGSYFHLATRPDILEDYFHSGQLLTSPTLSRWNYLKTPSIKIWENLENNEELVPISSYFHRNNLNSGITLTVNNSDSREMFYFGTHQKMDDPRKFWMNAIMPLHDFIKYYSAESKSIIVSAENYKIDLAGHIGNEFFEEKPQNKYYCANPEAKSINFKQALLEHSLDEKKLTTREKSILKLCLKGKSAKQIATELFLSHRTVENHMQQIRIKFDCQSTHELLARFITE